MGHYNDLAEVIIIFWGSGCTDVMMKMKKKDMVVPNILHIVRYGDTPVSFVEYQVIHDTTEP